MFGAGRDAGSRVPVQRSRIVIILKSKNSYILT
jgi:hypothetical protein